MKNIKICFFIFFLAFSIQDVHAGRVTDSVTKTLNVDSKTNQTNTEALKLRRAEIKNMDKSTLSFRQKKELRQEDRVLKKEQVHGGGGIYLSLSAVVIVLLLLIILL